jgi:sugar lactone lactonase YvrE
MSLATDRPLGTAETVHEFHAQMPTGVTVADDGRVFVCYPRWGDTVEFTVAELRDGEEVAYPNAELNVFDEDRPAECLVSVQSVVVDPAGRLWLLDTGSIELGPRIEGGAKLVCVDLATNAVERTIVVPADVALETTYLNDIRFDLRRGDAGLAFITDSTNGEGPSGIIVVDLASGRAWRKLHDHPSVRKVDGHLAVIEGRPVPGLAMAADGIAISADGERLFYCPLASRRLYSVSVGALADERAGDETSRPRCRTTARRAPRTAWSQTRRDGSTPPTTSTGRSFAATPKASGRRSSTAPTCCSSTRSRSPRTGTSTSR